MFNGLQPISSFLTERKIRIKPDEANSSGLSRIEKIDFSGTIHLVEGKETKTDMILVKKGDLVISGINVAKGALAVYEGDDDVMATIHYSAYSFDTEKIDIEFLKWFLKSPAFVEALIDQTGGGIKTEIKAKKFLSLKIPLPSFEEQKQIESKLNTFQNRYLILIKEFEKQTKLIKRLRASILSDAIKYEENDWQKSVLLDVITNKPRNGLSLLAVPYETSTKSLTLSATSSGVFKKEYCKYLDVKIEQDSYLWLTKGDILIQRANSSEYVGIAAIYTEDDKEFIYPDLMMKIQVKTEIITPEFLHILLLSPKSRAYFVENSVGTSSSMKKINQGIVSSLPIAYPSIDEQHRIVAKVEQLMTTCDALEAEVAKSRTETDRLMQTILKEAFEK